MKKYLIILLISTLLLCACSNEAKLNYQQITAEEAKTMIDEYDDEIILDVREQHEYDEKHIPDAILLPLGTITEETAAAVIPDKEAIVLVYCRSGNRSKTASKALSDLGYTQIYEFGGISAWPYEVVQ